MRGSMDETTVEPDGELLEALAIAAPAPFPESVWHRLFEHGLSRGAGPRKIGRAARPFLAPSRWPNWGSGRDFWRGARSWRTFHLSGKQTGTTQPVCPAGNLPHGRITAGHGRGY